LGFEDSHEEMEFVCKSFIVCCFYGPQIAVEGCAHGDLDNIYATLQYLEHTNDIKIELLICCGDFQVQIFLCNTYGVIDFYQLQWKKEFLNFSHKCEILLDCSLMIIVVGLLDSGCEK